MTWIAILRTRSVRPQGSFSLSHWRSLKTFPQSWERIDKSAHNPCKNSCKLGHGKTQKIGCFKKCLDDHTFANYCLTNLWFQLTFALLNLGTVLQPKCIWGRGGWGRGAFVFFHHCPVWRWGSHFFLILVNYHITVDVFSNTNSAVLLFIPVPFFGDRYWSSCRLLPRRLWVSVIFKSFI